MKKPLYLTVLIAALNLTIVPLALIAGSCDGDYFVGVELTGGYGLQFECYRR